MKWEWLNEWMNEVLNERRTESKREREKEIEEEERSTSWKQIRICWKRKMQWFLLSLLSILPSLSPFLLSFFLSYSPLSLHPWSDNKWLPFIESWRGGWETILIRVDDVSPFTSSLISLFSLSLSFLSFFFFLSLSLSLSLVLRNSPVRTLFEQNFFFLTFPSVRFLWSKRERERERKKKRREKETRLSKNAKGNARNSR